MKKALVIVGLVLLLALGVWTAFSATTEDIGYRNLGDTYLEFAQSQLDKGGYGAAIDYIREAISVEASADRYLQLAEAYYSSGQYDTFVETLESTIEKYPSDARAYKQLANYYYEQMAYSNCVEVLLAANDAGCLDEEMLDQYYTAAYQFFPVSAAFDEAHVFYGDYALVRADTNVSYVTIGMTAAFGLFEEASPCLNTVAAVKVDGRWGFFTHEGIRYMETEMDLLNAWSISSGYALVETEDGCYFLTTHGTAAFGPFKDACSFYENAAAVETKDGWYLIDTQGNQLNDEPFSRVLVNEDNICCCGGVIFADSGKGYNMYDQAGNLIAETQFADAQLFYTGNYAAVKVGDKWGFVDKEGEMVMKAEYADARSFGNGIAAVCSEDGLWGFITPEGRVVIDYQFQDAKCFNDDGYAPVKTEEGWEYIHLTV